MTKLRFYRLDKSRASKDVQHHQSPLEPITKTTHSQTYQLNQKINRSLHLIINSLQIIKTVTIIMELLQLVVIWLLTFFTNKILHWLWFHNSLWKKTKHKKIRRHSSIKIYPFKEHFQIYKEKSKFLLII